MIAVFLPPSSRFAIQPIFIQLLLKPHTVHIKFGNISRQLNNYWSDCKSQCGSWKSCSNCTIYMLIILLYNQNPKSLLQAKFSQVCANDKIKQWSASNPENTSLFMSALRVIVVRVAPIVFPRGSWSGQGCQVCFQLELLPVNPQLLLTLGRSGGWDRHHVWLVSFNSLVG